MAMMNNYLHPGVYLSDRIYNSSNYSSFETLESFSEYLMEMMVGEILSIEFCGKIKYLIQRFLKYQLDMRLMDPFVFKCVIDSLEVELNEYRTGFKIITTDEWGHTRELCFEG